MNYPKTISSALLTVLLLSGCGINPVPVTPDERLATMMQDQGEMYAKQEPLTRPLTFYDALARALKYNYDHRLSLMEAVLQDTQLEVATLNMLPKLTANAGYQFRERQLGSASEDYFNPGQNVFRQGQFATSQDASRGIADLTFAWNVLDFGVSYFQAKQQADRILIAQERRRKVVNNLIKEILQACWSASIAERLLHRARAGEFVLSKKVMDALAAAGAFEQHGKLVTAEAGGEAVVAQAVREPRGDDL
mgnify:CR=1 FL=1